MSATTSALSPENIEYRKLRLISQIAEMEDEVLIRSLEDILSKRKITKHKKGNKSTTSVLWANPPKIRLDAAAFRQRLLDGPTWTEEDIKKLEGNILLLKNWSIEQW